jgi:hypothetical protein
MAQVAEQIGACDMVVNADLCAAQAAEIFLCQVHGVKITAASRMAIR